MLETLYELAFPPGLVNNGTTYQTKGRWHVGNGIRFHQGTVGPIGGWDDRTLTGATMAGTPNAMLSWESANQLQFVAVGTTSGLYVIHQATNVVYTITPAVTSDLAPPYQWDLTTFGTYLIAVLRASGQLGGAISTTSTVYRWTGNVSAVAVENHSGTTGPQSSYGVVVTPERFLVLLRGADPGDYTRDPLWTD